MPRLNPLHPLAANNKGKNYPVFVLEVGLSETEEQLRADAINWLGPTTGVQVVLIIKLKHYKKSPIGTPLAQKHRRVRMMAELWGRGPPPVIIGGPIEFGTAGRTWDSVAPGCNGLGTHLISVPKGLMQPHIQSLAQPPAWFVAAPNFVIDLFLVQTEILDSLDY
eukprot:TRINITY_DN5312_c0_g1_i1.p1 TRINITY_DN5312_c0_g1~~TRINITY_DN5312_c0_g1_i1.p1  ORF type:complete len:165 (-),score=17.86 TRINITY_DN5312_c0_g1_i1:20-514(-)